MTEGYLDRLARPLRRDAAPSSASASIPIRRPCPTGSRRTSAGSRRSAGCSSRHACRWCSAVKANLAFFEAFGPDGIAALERVRATIPADVPFIADAKRGDIGSTAARQAAALYDRLGADAITVNPYLGGEAIRPLLERADRFAYVLCRTSNPGAGELQELTVAAAADAPAESLSERGRPAGRRLGPGRDGRAGGRRDGSRRAGPGPGRRARSGVPRSRRRSAGRRGRAGPARRTGGRRDRGGRCRGRAPRQRLAGHRERRRGVHGAASARDPATALAATAREWAKRLPVLL